MCNLCSRLFSYWKFINSLSKAKRTRFMKKQKKQKVWKVLSCVYTHLYINGIYILILHENSHYITSYKKNCFFLNIYFSVYNNISVLISL